MTIASAKSFVTVNTDGINKTFPYDFIIFALDKLELFITDANGIETEILTNFSLTGIGDPAGGTFTYPVTGDPLDTGSFLTLRRKEPYTQLFDPINSQAFNAESIETTFDTVVAQVQQNRTDIDRAVKIGIDGIGDPDDFLADISQAVVDAQTAQAAAEAAQTAAETAQTAAELAEAEAEGWALVAETLVAGVSFSSEQQTAGASQTEFTLGFPISAQVKSLLIWVDGVFQNRDQYSVTVPVTVDFGTPLVGGEVITFVSVPFA